MGLKPDVAIPMWIQMLYNRFGNGQKREDSDQKEVIERKRFKTQSGARVTAGNIWFVVPNYNPPLSDDDEDNCTTESHKISSVDILLQYPCLRMENEAIHEVQRLFGVNLHSMSKEKIGHFSTLVKSEFSRSKSKFRPYVDSIYDISNIENANENDIAKLGGYIAVLLSEDPRLIISSEANESASCFNRW